MPPQLNQEFTNFKPDRPSSIKVISIVLYLSAGITLLSSLLPLFMAFGGIKILFLIIGNIVFLIITGRPLEPNELNIDEMFSDPSFNTLMGRGGLTETQFMIIGATILLFAFFQFYNAFLLKKGRFYWLCLLLSCFNLLNFPIGTIVGLTSLVILTREDVKQYFESQKG